MFIREMKVPMDRVSPGTHWGLFGFSRSLRGLFRVSLRYLWGLFRINPLSLRGLFRGPTGSLRGIWGAFLGHFLGSLLGLFGVSIFYYFEYSIKFHQIY